ncbi:glycosyltransferase family 1 protein, partial [Pseudonocardia alni]
AVDRALADPSAARRRARAARARLRTDFAWPVIAGHTARIYAGATAAGPRELPRPKIPTGNLFSA